MTYNELIPSAAFTAFLILVGALYLSRLKGHGLWRYCETVFVFVAILMAFSFFTGLHEVDVKRLLPLWDGSGDRSFIGVVRVFGSFFADMFAAIYIMSGDCRKEELVSGARMGAAAAGIMMALYRIKCIGIIGYATAERYIFPVYALSGLQRIGSYGIHIEDIITCALAVARMVKLAVLIRFCSECFARLTGKSRGLYIWLCAFIIASVSLAGIGCDQTMMLWLSRMWIIEGAVFAGIPIVSFVYERLRDRSGHKNTPLISDERG